MPDIPKMAAIAMNAAFKKTKQEIK